MALLLGERLALKGVKKRPESLPARVWLQELGTSSLPSPSPVLPQPGIRPLICK